jgi:putative SOS response-associated peptidase YedK
MCGRYGLTIEQEALAVAYGVDALLTDHQPRYNIAPTQTVPAIVEGNGQRRVGGLRWGLIPSGATDPSVGNRMINARSETVGVRGAFRRAWSQRRRCLILADGFYEWRKPPSGKGPKVPHWIRMADGRPFGFAGLWERWRGKGEEIRSCTILTTDANELVLPIHDRMPVILGHPEEWDAWIDPSIPSPELDGLFRPYEPEDMAVRRVSTYVNNPANEGPACIDPVA